MPEQDSLDAALDQADEYDSFLQPLKVHVGERVFEIPHPNMLDDDQQEAFDELQHEANQCDRHPDVEIPEETVTSKDGTVTTTKARTIRGDFINPYQKDGKRMKPGYAIRLARIYLGDRYEEFKQAGGRSNQVATELAKAARRMRERQAADSKSVGGDSNLAEVSDAD